MDPKVAAKQIVISNDRRKAIFNKAVGDHAKDNKIVYPGYLRMEAKITNGKTTYEFVVGRQANTDSPTENKLDYNDKFIVSDLGFFMMARNRNLIGAEVLHTFPSVITFLPFTGFDNRHLDVFYNGKLSLVVNSTKWIEGLDLRRFRLVPQTQEAYTTNGGVPPMLVAFTEFSQMDEHSGFVEMTPQITLKGNEKNSISISAPVANGHQVENTKPDMDNYLVIFMRGLQITDRK